MGNILLLIGFVKKVLRLNGILKSQTTRDQAKIAFPLAVIFLLLGFIVPEWADPAMAAAAAVTLSPAIARFLLWKKPEETEPEEIKLPDVYIFRAKHVNDKAWFQCDGTLYDARAEGYDIATDKEGREWDVHTGEPTGITYHIPNPAPAGKVRDFVDSLMKDSQDD